MVNFTPEQLTAEKMINKCHHCPTDNCYLITKSLTKKSKINRKKYIGTVHYLTLMSMCKTGISIS